MKEGILTVGSIALDSIETPYGRVKSIAGGSAVHFSLAASVFSTVKIVGVIGEDFPQETLEFIESKGVDISGIEIKKGEKTFRWSGFYEKDMAVAHTKETQLNVFEKFNPTLPESFRKTPLVFLANIDPSLQLKVIEQLEEYQFICADTMNYWIERKKEELWKVVGKIDLLILNDQEVRQLSGLHNLLKASQRIFNKGLRQALIVKKGENGATIFFKDGSYFSIPGYLLEDVIDPTGAGDSFAGGFLGYLSTRDSLEIEELKKGLVYGNALGSFNVQGFGYSKVATLDREEVEARVQEIVNIFTLK